eukprot:CAMPEP_0117765326 /NCGR_PEP_ID=MMETSP0947-20121206/20037_1 /TAXON_ID=44440 /ORGANISM="Chattonella subsalsa, Strain CCMP2191" /LENGTH=237 /DNA_ID=CAMNT_0005587943 /DNA_START=375 /DNA_END=1088 /DNA_ORIENTATION=+
MISVLRIGSLKAATYCLIGLFFYDIFWVFFSSHFFGENVMVEVATRNSQNPAGNLAKALNVPVIKNAVSELQLPMKLIVPNWGASHFSMLGLGDIAIPGIFLAFALQYDFFLRQKAKSQKEEKDELSVELLEMGTRRQDQSQRNTPDVSAVNAYFRACLIGYVIGLLLSGLASAIFRAAQPALLYLVPCVLGPLVYQAYKKSNLKELWNGFEKEKQEGDELEERANTSSAFSEDKHM